MGNHTGACCSPNSILERRSGEVTTRQKPADNDPRSIDRQEIRKAILMSPSIKGDRGLGWMTLVNTCERSSKGRYPEQAEDADRLEPTGNVVGRRSEFVSLVDIQHHRCIERTYLILLLMRNTVNPISSVRGRQPQGNPMR